MTFLLTAAAQAQAPQRVPQAGAVQTGEALRAGGPLRLVSTSGGLLFLVTGKRPVTRPNAPVEVWSWIVYPSMQGSGAQGHDMLVTRERVDCAANTLQILGLESYRDRALVTSSKTGRPAQSPKEGTIGHARLQAVCDPGFRPDAPVYADIGAARAAGGKSAVAQQKPAPPALAAASPLQGTAKPAPTTGEALRAGGPLRQVRDTVAFTTMVSGPAPMSRPAAPVEVWRWFFMRRVAGEEGSRYDAIASRVRVDCAANTVREIVTEHYRNGILVHSKVPKIGAYTPSPGTGEEAGLKGVCEPGFNAKASTYPDFRAARAAVPLAPERPALAAASPQQGAAKPAPTSGVAERAGGPLRLSGTSPGAAFMAARPLPKSRPSAPIEFWSWIFMDGDRKAGDDAYDTIAQRLRIDCAASSVQTLTREIYRNGTLIRSLAGAAAPRTLKPGMNEHDLYIRAECEPGALSDPQTFADHRAARAATLKHFAAQKGAAPQLAGTPAQKQATAPAAAPAQKKDGTGWAVVSGNPIREVSTSPNIVFMVDAPRPARRPTVPVDVWAWLFDRQAQGPERFDTLAVRYRVDCAAGTMQARANEAYRDNVPLRFASTKEEPSSPKPGTSSHDIMRAVCEPGFKPNTLTFPNHRAARAAASKFFAARKGK